MARPFRWFDWLCARVEAKRRGPARRNHHSRGERLERRDFLTILSMTLADRDGSTSEGETQFTQMASMNDVVDGRIRFELESTGAEPVHIMLTSYQTLTFEPPRGPDGGELADWSVQRTIQGYSDQTTTYEYFIVGMTSAIAGVNTFTLSLDGAQEIYGWIPFDVKVNPIARNADTRDAPLKFEPKTGLDGSTNLVDDKLDLHWFGVPGKPVEMANQWRLTQYDASQGQAINTETVEVRDGDSLEIRPPAQESTDLNTFYYKGWFVEYNSSTGDLVVRAGAIKLTAIEIKSKSNRFLIAPATIPDRAVFDVFVPGKLFRLYPNGIDRVVFPGALPPHLSRAELETDLGFSGAFAGGGGTQTAIISIDGDVTYEDALRHLLPRVPKVSRATGEISLATLPGQKIDTRINYTWNVDEFGGGNAIAPSPQVKAIAESSSDLGTTWQAVGDLAPCATSCRFDITFQSAVSYDHTLLRIRNDSRGTPLIIHEIQAVMRPLEYQAKIEIHVPAGQDVMVASNDSFATTRTYDTSGQFITDLVPFLRSEAPEGTDFIIELNSPKPWQTVRFTSVPSSAEYWHDRRRPIATSNGFLSYGWTVPLDERSCDLSGWTWDGPSLELQPLSDLRRYLLYKINGPLAEGYYHLRNTSGVCSDTLGRPLIGDLLMVDYVKPTVFSSPPAHHSVSEGQLFLSWEFSEPISTSTLQNIGEGSVTIYRQGEAEPLQDIAANVSLSGRHMFVEVDQLSVGQYVIALPTHSDCDEANNCVTLDATSMTLDVLPRPLESIPPTSPLRFDLDRNGTLEPIDYYALRFELERQPSEQQSHPASEYDVTGDGLFQRADLAIVARDYFHFVAGDVDLDGDFDQDDLSFLNRRPLGQLADWTSGDFNGDGIFDRDDLIYAFQVTGWDEQQSQRDKR